MKGKTILFWLGLIGVAGAFLFQTAYQVQGLEEELVSLNRQIVREQESIQILKAEWSYLNTPTRLEKLAREYLHLQPSEARQFVARVDAVPLRPESAIASEIVRPSLLPAVQPINGTAPAKTVPAKALPATAPVLIPASAPVKAPRTTGATALASAPAAGPAALVAPRAVQPQAPVSQQAAAVRPPAAPAPGPKSLTPPSGNARAPSQPAAATGRDDDAMGMLIARLGGNR